MAGRLKRGREMKPSLRSRQEPRRVSNAVIIGAMLLSLCILSIVKARYCATPFGTYRVPPPILFSARFDPCRADDALLGPAAGKAEDQLQEQMNSSIRMETDEESPARTPGGQLPFFFQSS